MGYNSYNQSLAVKVCQKWPLKPYGDFISPNHNCQLSKKWNDRVPDHQTFQTFQTIHPGKICHWVAWTETTTQMGPTGFRLEVVLRCWIPPYSDPKWMDSTLNHTKPGFRLGMFGGSELGGMDYQGLLGLLQNRSGVCRCMHMVQVHNDIHTFNIIIIYIIYNITIEAIQKYS